MKKVMITLLCLFFLTCVSIAAFATVYFITPSRRAEASISLPDQVVDAANATEDSTQNESDTYDNIYIADVYQSLTLRAEPDVNAQTVAELAPMTKMQVNSDADNSGYAYVEIINGDYAGYTGYVNCDYITKWGEPTTRISYDDGE